MSGDYGYDRSPDLNTFYVNIIFYIPVDFFILLLSKSF